MYPIGGSLWDLTRNLGLFVDVAASEGRCKGGGPLLLTLWEKLLDDLKSGQLHWKSKSFIRIHWRKDTTINYSTYNCLRTREGRSFRKQGSREARCIEQSCWISMEQNLSGLKKHTNIAFKTCNLKPNCPTWTKAGASLRHQHPGRCRTGCGGIEVWGGALIFVRLLEAIMYSSL